jgi:hypothetical protein
MPIFDIPSNRLVDLSDADLRELIARLCEAERERQGGHRNEVRWGGSQTAADGGLDVVVEPTGPFIAAGPLARRDVGIQVKAADLTPGAIVTEMRPGGDLRPAISAIAARGGSYLIASAGANCSEAMLKRRVDAMREAVADDPNGTRLELALLDRNAISRWVSTHPSVAAWLRRRLDLPILAGWQPFGRWSSTPEGEVDDLICEEGLVFHIERRAPIRNLPEALDEIRKLVRDGTGAVRIAGLSGIGKSRIAQALFEPIGSVSALPVSHAVYTDLGHSPNPTPTGMLEALIERSAPAVLVVDNCPPDTHQALARKLAERPGAVRLVTVEYDVRNDRPEETDVIRVEAEGSDIVEALLRRRRTDLSTGDARRLAELAQGNARLGFALAQAIPQTGSLTAFDDATLFDRLFWQREERNEELARAAEVLSLVYSFEVEGDEQPDELLFLGSLAELSRGAMHRHASTLLDRGLAQARSRWRAVLPHALANRLARKALRSIPFRNIADGFADKPRLRRSLARRLSYLHDCDEARRIVNRWMETGGPLHGTAPDLQVLEAVCHLVPEDALHVVNAMATAIAAAPEEFLHLDSLTRMIARIAHSEVMFPQACESLVSLAIIFDKQRASNADDVLSSLFGLYLSGTLAKTEARVQVASQYLLANNANQNSRGVSMLKSALRTGHWSSSILSFDDARPDSFGWEPRGAEVVDWFSRWLELAAHTALAGPVEVRDSVRKALSDEIDGIWRRLPTLRSKIDAIARQLHEEAPWVEGWHALRRMRYLSNKRGEELSAEDSALLQKLIDDMAPTDLSARVRAETVRGWDLDSEDDDHRAAEARRAERLELLGQELAASPDVLHAVGRDLFEHKGRPLYSIGIGLVQGNREPRRTWEILRDLYLSNPDKPQQIGFLSGLLHQLDESSPEIAESIRVECRETPALRRIYSVFLRKGVLPGDEFKNVVEIAGEAETAAWLLHDIAWREERELNDEQRVQLLRSLLGRDGGALLVVDALQMLGFVEKGSRDAWPDELKATGVDAVIAILTNETINSNIDHDMAETLSYCMRGESSALAARCMDAIIARAARRYGSTYDVERTLAVLARKSPQIFLSRLFPDGEDGPSIRLRSGLDRDCLIHVPVDPLIEWCHEDPTRWAKVAPNISPFARGSQDNDEVREISAQALGFLNAAPRPEEVVEAYLEYLAPMSWSGSRADIMESRLKSIETLIDHPAPEVRHSIVRLAPGIRARIARIRQAEQEEERERDQRFEW